MERRAAARNLWHVIAAMSRADDGARWRARADAIVDVARGLAERGPAPRGEPFFGLDHVTGTPLPLVEQLAGRGIFRKYEHVLDLGAGLGATTRYLAARLGCSATATARTRGEATAGRMLTARAALDWQVFHAVGDPARLPFADAAFTHVWVLDVLGTLGPADRVLAEAYRVLRPGGHFGVQEPIARRHDASDGVVTAETLRRDLERAGFLEVVCRETAADGTGRPEPGLARLARRLGDDPLVRERLAMERALATGGIALVQLTARRP